MFYLNTKEMFYILTVVEEGSLSKTAEKLYTTQPNLTRLIRKEEEKIGMPIFNKGTLPWSLTYAGELYVIAAKEILKINNNFTSQTKSILNEQKGLIRLGMMDFEQTYLMPTMLPIIKENLPQVKFTTQIAPPCEVTSLLYKNLVDFAIVVTEDATDVEYLPIKTYDIILVLPINHPLARNYKYPKDNKSFQEIDIESLIEEQFISIRGSKLAQTIKKTFGVKLNIEQFVDTPYGAISMVEAGLGVTFVLDSIIKDRHKLNRTAFFKFRGLELKQEISLAYLKNKKLNKLEKQFIEIVINTLYSKHS